MRKIPKYISIISILIMILCITYFLKRPKIKWYSLEKAQKISEQTGKIILFINIDSEFIFFSKRRQIIKMTNNYLPVKVYVLKKGKYPVYTEDWIFFPEEINNLSEKDKKIISILYCFCDHKLQRIDEPNIYKRIIPRWVTIFD